MEHLQDEGKLDALLESGARFSRNILVLNAHREGKLEEQGKWRTGGPLVFDRVWSETGCAAVIRKRLINPIWKEGEGWGRMRHLREEVLHE
ncbi:MAG: hypothetical protein KA419_15585 [Acidobacteria bacterium]|nr:hypothetical protein [Acidobacteriota bacterium]